MGQKLIVFLMQWGLPFLNFRSAVIQIRPTRWEVVIIRRHIGCREKADWSNMLWINIGNLGRTRWLKCRCAACMKDYTWFYKFTLGITDVSTVFEASSLYGWSNLWNSFMLDYFSMFWWITHRETQWAATAKTILATLGNGFMEFLMNWFDIFKTKQFNIFWVFSQFLFCKRQRQTIANVPRRNRRQKNKQEGQ